MVLHPVEGVLARPVARFQAHAPLRVGPGVPDQLVVDVTAFGLAGGDRGLVGEEHPADRALPRRLRCGGDEGQTGDEEVAVRQAQPPSGVAEVGRVVHRVHRDHIGTAAVQVAGGDLLDDDADPARDHDRARSVEPRGEGGQLDAQPLGQRARETGDDDVGLQRPDDHVVPGHGLDGCHARVGDLLRGKRGTQVRHDDTTGESAGFEFPLDTGTPFQLGIESGHQQSCSHKVLVIPVGAARLADPLVRGPVDAGQTSAGPPARRSLPPIVGPLSPRRSPGRHRRGKATGGRLSGAAGRCRPGAFDRNSGRVRKRTAGRNASTEGAAFPCPASGAPVRADTPGPAFP